MSRIENEKRVVAKMVMLYCKHKEGNASLCDECKSLIEYAHSRLDRCRFGENKPTCRKCPIHCYQPEMRQKIKDVMRYSGPRMILYSPCMAIAHLCREVFYKIRR